MENYNTYRLSLRDRLCYLLRGALLIIILGSLFYRSIAGVLILSPLICFYYKDINHKLLSSRKWKLNLEFKDALMALSAALESGYSTEHSFEEACRDLRQIYQENAVIIKEFTYILRQLRMNITVEKALSDFGERTGIEDILNFSEVFSTSKRTGGDIIHVIKVTSNVISGRIEVKREIVTLLAAKRLEANIMKVIPLLILVYLSVSSPDFLTPLYHNLFGIIVMTLLLLCYLGAYLLIDNITAIEV